ncbi:MAG: hypothetical protein FJY76_01515 [Candidatus Aenigmarchaeota archaeon]|nr:hypothetical protein [Candidatus Aenigmarchaeota archaeon]
MTTAIDDMEAVREQLDKALGYVDAFGCCTHRGIAVEILRRYPQLRSEYMSVAGELGIDVDRL